MSRDRLDFIMAAIRTLGALVTAGAAIMAVVKMLLCGCP